MEDVSCGTWAWMKLRYDIRGCELDSSGSEKSDGAVLQQKKKYNKFSFSVEAYQEGSCIMPQLIALNKLSVLLEEPVCWLLPERKS